MGKKRVVQKGGTSDSSKKKSTATKKLPKISEGRVYIKASYNNTMVSVTDENGNMVASSSSGSLGFKGPKKATPYAATQVVSSLGEAINKMGLQKVSVFINGIGSGRESALRALPSQGLEIVSIKDVTPIPHNGPRPRKPRRV